MRALRFILLSVFVATPAVALDPNVYLIQLHHPRYEKDIEFWATQDNVYLDVIHLAQLGHVKSMFNAGMMAHIRGATDQALYWYERAADRNHKLAAYNLATLYYEGEGVAQDYEEAAQYMERAAHLGLTQAQFELAKMYYHGRGVPQSYEREAYWYLQAAESGHPAAAHNLAVLYAKGEGVEQNKRVASEWLERSRSSDFEPDYR